MTALSECAHCHRVIERPSRRRHAAPDAESVALTVVARRLLRKHAPGWIAVSGAVALCSACADEAIAILRSIIAGRRTPPPYLLAYADFAGGKP